MRYTENDLQTIARHTLKELASRSTNVLALHGDLGAGKTTLVSSIAKELGVREGIISPTFIIFRIYKLPDIRPAGDLQTTDNRLEPNPATTKLWQQLVHIDAYRLTGEDDAKKLHLDELLADPANLVCIEWPENVGGVLPSGALRATLAYTAGNERTIEFK